MDIQHMKIFMLVRQAIGRKVCPPKRIFSKKSNHIQVSKKVTCFNLSKDCVTLFECRNVSTDHMVHHVILYICLIFVSWYINKNTLLLD